MIAGYYDKSNNKINPSVVANAPLYKKSPIRLTAFSDNHPVEWHNTIRYVQYLDKLYKSIFKDDYTKRKRETKHITNGLIDNTIFTTLTLNYNFRTACHVDNGNTHYSILTTIGQWQGCYLGYPQYGVCVNVEEGDFLIMNTYEYHCHTAFAKQNQHRMSIVTYSRSGIIDQ